nr:MAG TPA: hypothetical protein [Caudoviricetes sp.]
MIKHLLVTNTTLRTAITALANPRNYPGYSKIYRSKV